MHLSTDKFIRGFLIYGLPNRFHRIRHYGLLASSPRNTNMEKARTLRGAQEIQQNDRPSAEILPLTLSRAMPECGGLMRIIENRELQTGANATEPTFEHAYEMGTSGTTLEQHHVGSHRADRGPKHDLGDDLGRKGRK